MKKQKITKILFIIYIIILVWIILFKLSFNFSDIGRLRSVNLIPFKYDIETTFQLKEVIDNILIFIPMGVLLKMLRIDNKRTILFGFLTSLSFEIMQYMFQIGVSDITDIITNTTGTIIGMLFYIILCKIFKNREKIDKILKILGTIGLILFLILIIIILVNN